MSYRNKTYVAFASEDIGKYRLMEAWKANPNFDFNFYDAHTLYVSRDTSQPGPRPFEWWKFTSPVQRPVTVV